MSVTDLPLVNAILNSITTLLLICGFVAIKKGNTHVHRAFMISALITSTIFLTCYLIHKFSVGPTKFEEEGWIRALYFTILISHTILAILNLPLILRLVYLAVRQRFRAHRKLARWTYPIWMYVSVTGVIVYLFLYQWFPPASA